MGHWTFGQSLMTESSANTMASCLKKGRALSQPLLQTWRVPKKKKKKKRPNTSFKLSLHEHKKGTPMHLISINTLVKNPCLQAYSLFRVNGNHQAHTLLNHIGNMALSSLSYGTCIQPYFHDYEWIPKNFELGFQNQL